MNISRHNYEEYFLLYVDGELQPDECEKVETFVQQNPDLSEEFELLKQSTLHQDDVFFTEKDVLYKPLSAISKDNYQSYFLMYTDGELNDEENQEVERFVLQHPDLQFEFTSIQQSKLIPQKLVFANKHVLYRNHNQRRIIKINRFRFSAAAAVVGIILFSGIRLLNNDSTQHQTVVAYNNSFEKKTSINKPFRIAENANSAGVESVTVKQEKEVQTDLVQSNPTVQAGLNVQMVQQKRKQLPEQVAPAISSVKHSIQSGDNVVEQRYPASTEVVTEFKDRQSFTEAPPGINNIRTIDNNTTAVAAIENIQSENRSIVSNAVYREIDTNEYEQDAYIGSASINKNKLRGLLKKVARIVGRNANQAE